jgi:anaerobic dimethyl sulfoxide reductase subunit A
MMAGMAHHIFTNNLQDQKFIDKFCLGMDKGTLPKEYADKENFKDYILGTYDKTPKTPEWAEPICGVKAADIRKLADLYAKTKPAALKASWAPGRAMLRRAVQPHGGRLAGHDRQHRHARRLRRGRGQGLACRKRGLPLRRKRQPLVGSIKSDRWAHCVLNYPNVKREEIGLWPRE